MSQEFSRPLLRITTQSVLVSNVLVLAVSYPAVMVGKFIDTFSSEYTCQMFRFITLVFPIVAIMNLLTYGIERYFSVFYPYTVLSGRWNKLVIALTWIIGALVVMMLITMKHAHGRVIQVTMEMKL